MCQFIEQIPNWVLATFSALGALWLGRKVISYIALIADLFFIKGTNVSSLHFALSAFYGIN